MIRNITLEDKVKLFFKDNEHAFIANFKRDLIEAKTTPFEVGLYNLFPEQEPVSGAPHLKRYIG